MIITNLESHPKNKPIFYGIEWQTKLVKGKPTQTGELITPYFDNAAEGKAYMAALPGTQNKREFGRYLAE